MLIVDGGILMFRIKELRKQCGMTQLQLAQKIGISREYLSAVENGHKYPSMALLIKISDILDTSVRDLLEDKLA